MVPGAVLVSYITVKDWSLNCSLQNTQLTTFGSNWNRHHVCLNTVAYGKAHVHWIPSLT